MSLSTLSPSQSLKALIKAYVSDAVPVPVTTDNVTDLISGYEAEALRFMIDTDETIDDLCVPAFRAVLEAAE
ncbi:hypothetical protein ACJ3XI_01220 [Litorimonas sp. RW-G-Af-16]|uniref:hypothetical protein n=1 Tax=Litorimonas sp. RW-G-Af-16 TaxID=3241168 RepID=UPI00390CAC3D